MNDKFDVNEAETILKSEKWYPDQTPKCEVPAPSFNPAPTAICGTIAGEEALSKIWLKYGRVFLNDHPVSVKIDKSRGVVKIGCTEVTFDAFLTLVKKVSPYVESSIVTIQE
jgi:hypothetical protein